MVLFDGVVVKDFGQHELRDRIGFIAQKGILFNARIKEKIDFVVKDVSDVIEKISEITQPKDFIETKNEKYNSRYKWRSKAKISCD